MTEPVTCPYCSKRAAFLPTSEAIYGGRNYGPMYVCFDCEAWCGCHPGTHKPLGRLANKELRQWKMKAHAAFDPVWKDRFKRGREADPKYRKGTARNNRYRALARALGIKSEECHIGLFDVELCQRTVEICASGALKD